MAKVSAFEQESRDVTNHDKVALMANYGEFTIRQLKNGQWSLRKGAITLHAATKRDVIMLYVKRYMR